MTRRRHVTQIASARTSHLAGAAAVSEPASTKFLSFEENCGAFHWAIVAASGDRLVRSANYASDGEARRTAGVVPPGAGAAPFEDRASDSPRLELAARRETGTVRDDLDAARWLDERAASTAK